MLFYCFDLWVLALQLFALFGGGLGVVVVELIFLRRS